MAILEDVDEFRKEWFSDTPTMTIYTSGSTGKPKAFLAEKKRMINSARMTCKFLGVNPRDTILLCMPMRYIAGKMVVVRSIVCNLRLVVVEPSGHPFADVNEHINFAALTPMQVYNTLQVANECKKMKEVDNLIIGGGAIDSQMSQVLRSFPHNVWSTYGMTETLSHIALRRLNGDCASMWYTPLENVKISLSTRETLIIDAPLVSATTLETNDIAEINDNGLFRIKGRVDNTINSGGIKIQIEELEQQLRPYIPANYAITSTNDVKFGEVVVLLVENEKIEDVYKICNEVLPKYWCPKHIINHTIPMTATNKIDRARSKEIVNSYLAQTNRNI